MYGEHTDQKSQFWTLAKFVEETAKIWSSLDEKALKSHLTVALFDPGRPAHSTDKWGGFHVFTATWRV